LNSHLTASCVRNIFAKHRCNPLIPFKVTIDNARVPFSRHSIIIIIQYFVGGLCDCVWDSFDPRERTICGMAMVTGGRGAVA